MHVRATRWGIVAALIGGSFVACALVSPDAERRRFFEGVLEERARGLDAGTRREIARALLDAESRHGVDAFLLAAVAEQESHFRPGATSRHGARGLMQIRPATAKAVASRHGIAWRGPDDLEDPSVAIAVGAAYLAELESEFGSWELALAAYLRGPTRVRALVERGSPPTSRYATRVLEKRRRLEDLYRGDS